MATLGRIYSVWRTACARDVAPLFAVMILAVLLFAAQARGATQQITYTPFDASGALLAPLTTSGEVNGNCDNSGMAWESNLVPGAYRCNSGNAIYDPCYQDVAAATKSVICAESPWELNVTRIDVPDLIATTQQPSDRIPPWALELVNGRKCIELDGATGVLYGKRISYSCPKMGRKPARYLLGAPNRRTSTWKIVQVDGIRGGGKRVKKIATAWR